MYVHRVSAANFRVFGARDTGESLNLTLNPGLNVLVGENDAGKTSIVDVLRYVLLTSSNDYIRIEDDDFHIQGVTHAEELVLEVELRGLSEPQQAALLDWLTFEEGIPPYLVVNLHAKRRLNTLSTGRLTQPIVRVNAGKDGSGPELGSAARELIRATYLKPLRDAVAELRPKKSSRLSQVLRAHKDVKKEALNNFDKLKPDEKPNTLVEIMAQAQHRIGASEVIKEVRNRLNTEYLKDLSFETAALSSDIRVASELSLVQVLEKLELTLSPPGSIHPDLPCERGLGYNNVLFMAAELLLLGEGDELALLLIEEPEAHLHPQLQARVLRMLATKANSAGIQVVVTTHSPNIASSASVENLILVCRGATFRLIQGESCLDAGDYEFLRRFLDVSKANLFFARGVAIVEGSAEEILFPALAECCGRSFEANGVSMVNVGSVGLFRYARILQRSDGTAVPIKVACLGDRDIVPDEVTYVKGRIEKERDKDLLPKNRKQHPNRKVGDYSAAEVAEEVEKKKSRARGGNTEVFVSDYWTLEYDLLRSGLAEATFCAIRLEQAEGSKGALSEKALNEALEAALKEWTELQKTSTAEMIAADTYELLHSKSVSKAVVAQYLAMLVSTGCYGTGSDFFRKLPKYLQLALDHLVPGRVT